MLDWSFYNNSIQLWLIAAGIAIAVFFGLYFTARLVARQFERVSGKTGAMWDDAIVAGVRAVRRWVIFTIAFWVGSGTLVLPPRLELVLRTVATFALLAQLGISGTAVVRAYVRLYGERTLPDDGASVTTARAIGVLISAVLWIVIFLVVLENLGIDVTALIAGLGIGGIAIALAVQRVLGDLLASLSIVLDKPFVVGDFVVVEEFAGTIEKVGLKTTRVRSLSGEQLVFSNSDLLESRIRNYKRMFERRIVFKFGVRYGTPLEDLEWISGRIKEIIDDLPDVRFDRAHFAAFGQFALEYEVVYIVLKPEYNLYMDRQEAINLALTRALEERGVSFALPTTRVHLATMPDGASKEVAG